MKILITNHHLAAYCGTEIFTYTIADALKKRGHDIVVYSPCLGEISNKFITLDIPVVNDLRYQKTGFDIAHIHHNILAYEVRNRYPDLPIIFISHGRWPSLEQPPPTNLGIGKYLAVGEEIQDNLLRYGIPQEKIFIFRNPVDEEKFYPENSINPSPQSALVISNKIDQDTESIIRQACSQLKSALRFIGGRFEYIPNDEIPEMIKKTDLVFSLSRGVIEAMLCGRAPIVFDKNGGDGLVTPENFHNLIKYNFTGEYYRNKYTVDELIREIKKYKQVYGESLRQLSLDEFSVKSQTDKLENIYEEASQHEVPVL